MRILLLLEGKAANSGGAGPALLDVIAGTATAGLVGAMSCDEVRGGEAEGGTEAGCCGGGGAAEAGEDHLCACSLSRCTNSAN